MRLFSSADARVIRWGKATIVACGFRRGTASFERYTGSMRIVLIAPDIAGRSGWSRYALDLGKALAAQGHEMHVIVAHTTGADWCTEHRLLRQPTSYLESRLLRWWHVRPLHQLLQELKPDVVHWIAEPYALLLPLMKECSWKNVLTIHGTYAVVPLRINASSRTLAEQYYKKMDAIISVSNFTKQYLQSNELDLFESADLQRRITVIHNAIDLSGISVSMDQPGDTLSVISVSAVKRKKGLMQAVDAVARFLAAYPVQLRYDIIGSLDADPAFIRELREKIRVLQLENVVTLCGSIGDKELDAAYHSADLFLMPSLQEGDYFEGFGLVFLEANARGTPVIGSNTGGCPEAIKEGTSGYVCDPEDIDALTERMADVLINKQIKRSDCRAWAEEHDSRKTAVAIEKIYQ